jgi:DNA polymerase III epsilon subunit family exonuclease
MTTITSDTSLSNIEFVAFDVETTGLSPVANRLVELSGVKFKLADEKVETFSTLIDPEDSIPPNVTAIHGITDEMVAGAPTAKEVVPDFLNWAGENAVFMAHNAPFDVEFMRVNIAKSNLPCPKNPVIDTLVLSRDLLLELRNHQLKTIVEHFDLPSAGFHRALADSMYVKEIFSRFVNSFTLLRWEDLQTLGSISQFDHDRYAEAHAMLPEEVQATLESIESAIREQVLLKMVYEGSFRSTRTVRPVSLIHSRGNFYMNAFCVRAKAERTFRVDRISGVKAI